ncbi:MAG TPA: HisA/HisF-related TIM barrel protein [Aestuariivirgaceae bacterium]|jgi:phosphoribosylformimino-5-aminoimidazole carboxamide ribotide isomerase|nr:HisA/HisF-related TIM barrel protein [Aestuariivirgaceae bacterium]
MQIVPVIDLKGALVVHARRGERGSYAPIETPLSRSAEPAAVLAGLLSVAPFRAVYVADLDAIMAGRALSPLIESLADHFPMLEFWVDAGIASPAAAEALLRHERLHLVIGSESQGDHRLLDAFRDHPRALLSLDFRGDQFIGPTDLIDRPEHWPKRVIAMTLARVGSGAGPDFDRLVQIVTQAPGRKIFAAGGVRDEQDLAALLKRGVAGALVATAIHQGAIRTATYAAPAH